MMGLKVKILLDNLSQTYELKATEVKYSLMLDIVTAMAKTGITHLAALAPTISISVKGIVSGNALADMKLLKAAAEEWWEQSLDPPKYYGEFWWHEGDAGPYTPTPINPDIGGGVWNQILIQRLNFSYTEGHTDSSRNPTEIEYTMDMVAKY
ncbi:MAG: hypothetical protein ACT6FG_00155 [Methanosarcinaceae archaeon]